MFGGGGFEGGGVGGKGGGSYRGRYVSFFGCAYFFLLCDVRCYG